MWRCRKSHNSEMYECVYCKIIMNSVRFVLNDSSLIIERCIIRKWYNNVRVDTSITNSGTYYSSMLKHWVPFVENWLTEGYFWPFMELYKMSICVGRWAWFANCTLHFRHFLLRNYFTISINRPRSTTPITMVSCQKGPTRHAYAWQIGPFWQDTLGTLWCNEPNNFIIMQILCCVAWYCDIYTYKWKQILNSLRPRDAYMRHLEDTNISSDNGFSGNMWWIKFTSTYCEIAPKLMPPNIICKSTLVQVIVWC